MSFSVSSHLLFTDRFSLIFCDQGSSPTLIVNGGAFKSLRQPMLKSPNAERLTEYYHKYFPVEELVYCLSKCSPLYLREFSFTLQNNVYTRFRSFETPHQLKEELCRITPLKIDVGAVYSASPEQRKSIPEDKFRTIFRELVFDLDISDYDDIRFCCKYLCISFVA
jgi:DNA primase small subunit